MPEAKRTVTAQFTVEQIEQARAAVDVPKDAPLAAILYALFALALDCKPEDFAGPRGVRKGSKWSPARRAAHERNGHPRSRARRARQHQGEASAA